MSAQQLNGLLLPIGFLVIFYIFAIRPQKKKEKEITAMRSNLKVGDEVITIGGICGKILRVKEDIIILEVGNTKTRLDVTKWAIGSVVNRNDNVASKKEEVVSEENEEEK
ncbi:preprotein translocase subunit YajC [Tissierella sp. Yu-01]|uniref:preprotein translocase subunit YajC n=1 Tax=Tissierella sp. Yu-01 TaxID=3035694 RepID=UPI00240D94E7|nr:preprotein translocase subunit YajC [Tissierella sp. Yu-01]WFA09851.1 preprotein translocase subunit YajC [Tissierella sp. Yu-01]